MVACSIACIVHLCYPFACVISAVIELHDRMRVVTLTVFTHVELWFDEVRISHVMNVVICCNRLDPSRLVRLTASASYPYTY